jgi:hypothetical protein
MNQWQPYYVHKKAAVASVDPTRARDKLLKPAREEQMRKYVLVLACSAGLLVAAPASAWATVSPTTGQPGAPTNTCGPDNPVTPGSSATANGSPFNGSGQAGVVYAGNPGTASLANANSTAAVSQYDVACVQLSH